MSLSEKEKAYHHAYYEANKEKWRARQRAKPKKREARRAWPKKDTERLASLYPTNDTKSVAAQLKRSVRSVYMQANILGIKKDPEFLREQLVALGKRASESEGSKLQRFKKGQVPPNKGVKGWDSGGRSHETRFKKGDVSKNKLPIGSHSLTKDGYLQRKITDTGCQRHDWRPVHILMWEEQHGPVPKGHIVRFINGDKTHIEISNLEMITMRENMARNTIARYPEPLRRVMHLTAKLKRKIDEKQDRGSAKPPVRDAGSVAG